MKITHVFSSFPSKGQNYNTTLIERLLNSGIDCNVVSLSEKHHVDNIDTYTIGHHFYLWPKYIINVFRYFKFFRNFRESSVQTLKSDIFYFGRFCVFLVLNPDIIHVHHIQLLNLHLRRFLSVTKIRCIVSLRGGDVLVRPFRSEKDKLFLKETIEDVKNLHFVSKHLSEVVNQFTDIQLNKYIIHRSAEVEMKIDSSSDINNLQIITIGRIHWTKGYVYALKALHLLKEDGYNFKYHICGSGSIEQTDELIYYINELGLSDYVILEGHLTSLDMDKLLSSATIYLQSSLSEGVPNTLLRALYYRVPTITTDAGGIPEIFRTSVDGFMVHKADPLELHKTLKKLLIDTKLQEKIRASNPPNFIDKNVEIHDYVSMYEDVKSKFIS